MVALLVTLSVMTVIMTVALPVLSTMAQRERETELVFRGQQYARAVSLFQKKYGNALPPNVDVLIEQKFLRKKYKDPITGDDFQVVGPGSPELALAMNAAPQTGQQQGRGANQQGQGQRQGQGSAFGQTQSSFGQAQAPSGMNQSGGLGSGRSANSGGAPGGVLGVVSKSPKTSIRLYNGHDKYNEWVFTATQMSVAAGGGARGGAAGGAGGNAGRGGRGTNQPQGDNRGRFGSPQSPFGGSPQQSPFGRDTGAPQGLPRLPEPGRP